MFSFKYLLGGKFTVVSFLFVGGHHMEDPDEAWSCDDARLVVALPDGTIRAAISDGISNSENSRFASARIVQSLGYQWFTQVYRSGWVDQELGELSRAGTVLARYSAQKWFRNGTEPQNLWINDSLGANGLTLRVDDQHLSLVRVSDLSVFLGRQTPDGCKFELLADDTDDTSVTPIGFHRLKSYGKTVTQEEGGLQALVTTDGFTRYLKEHRLRPKDIAKNDWYKNVAFQLPGYAEEGRESEWLELFRNMVATLVQDDRLSTTYDDITGVYVAPRSLSSSWEHGVKHPENLTQVIHTADSLSASLAAFDEQEAVIPNLCRGSIYRSVEGFEAHLSYEIYDRFGQMRMVKLSREGALGSDGMPIQWVDSRVLEDGTAIVAIATADPSHKDGAFAAGCVVHTLLLEAMMRENLAMHGVATDARKSFYFAGLTLADCREIVLSAIAELKSCRNNWRSDSAEIASLAFAIVHWQGVLIAHAGGSVEVIHINPQGVAEQLPVDVQEPLTLDGPISVALIEKKMGSAGSYFIGPVGTSSQLSSFANPLDASETGLDGVLSLMRQVPVNVAADAMVQQLDAAGPDQLPPSFVVVQIAEVFDPWVSALDPCGPVTLATAPATTSPIHSVEAVEETVDWKNMPEPKVDFGLLRTMSKVEWEEYSANVNKTWKKWARSQ